jgi:hypothetical protein
LGRAKVTANRVAVVVANEWKDANDKVMPVKQWLEERRFLQVIFCFALLCLFVFSGCAALLLLLYVFLASFLIYIFPHLSSL